MYVNHETDKLSGEENLFIYPDLKKKYEMSLNSLKIKISSWKKVLYSLKKRRKSVN